MENIFQYISIELYNPQSAIKLIDEFHKQFNLICEFPESCALVNNEFLRLELLSSPFINNKRSY